MARWERSSSYSAEAVAGAHRVDGHPDLHAVAAGEGERRCAATSARIARWPEIGALVSTPQRRRIAQRAKPSASAEAAADPAAEGGDREVALARSTAVDQRAEPRGRGAEIAVAEEDELRSAGSALSAASAAAVTLAPLPCGRPRLTT